MNRKGRELKGLEHSPIDQSRLFIREPGWEVHLKHGSERVFCFAMAPGEDYYHRLADGEIYLQRGDERLCLPCAGRQGLLEREPRALREGLVPVSLDHRGEGEPYDLTSRD